MLILGIETTADLCSLTIRDAEGTLVERIFRHRMHLSERLVNDVDALLADAGCALEDIEGFGVDIGPGSFTGVRIGVMTVKAWASLLARPVCAVTALEAIAAEYEGVEDIIIVPLIRARPTTVYMRLYRLVEDQWQALGDVETVTADQLANHLANASHARYLLCGEGLVPFREVLLPALRRAGVSAACGRAEPPRASTIARIAQRRLREGKEENPLRLVPYYVAPPPIDPRTDRSK